ncbi:MAG: GTP-binding protein [Chloroflexi bacterium]|nr:GTP-binding protein [Chloroflexota bacterium]
MKVNVVVAGHIDHGKSTLIGRLLYDSESIREGRLAEIQQLAEEYKKRFEFAYFIDSFEDELKEERTIDTTEVMFKSKKALYSIADVPGHKEFIKNMLTGASHAELAVLVVSAQEGVQEQTRRHAFLLKMLGIKRLFVVVNKMDVLDYSEESFRTVREDVGAALTSLGYSDVSFIPASAAEGENIYRSSQRMKWYRGPTLIEALDQVNLSLEPKPLRFVVQGEYRVESQEIIVGRVIAGLMKIGDEIVVQPSDTRTKIERIRVFPADQERAQSGDSVGLVIDGVAKRGDVLGLVGSAPMAVRRFWGEVVLLDGSLGKGEELELRCGTNRVKCEVREIKEKISAETGAIVEAGPSEIGENEAATVLLATEPLVVERFSDIPELGRFVLVKGNRHIGVGVVLEALE